MHFDDEWFYDEVRCGYYVDSLRKCSWAAQLEVAKEVERVAESCGLRLFADCGTLLGAVRHEGFIPWDDDVDFCMLRDDYEWFVSNCLSMLPEGYTAKDYRTPGFGELLLRISNGERYRNDPGWLRKYHGFPYPTGIDIFVLDYLSRDSGQEYIRKNLAKFVIDCAKRPDLDNNISDDTAMELARVLELTGASIDMNAPLKPQIMELGVGLFKIYRRSEADQVALMPFWIDHDNHVYDIALFDDTLRMPFENTTLLCPAGYEEVLKIEYGDFIRLEHGGGSHDFPNYAGMERIVESGMPNSRLPYKYYFEESDIADFEDRKYMNKNVKEQALNFIPLLKEAHSEARSRIENTAQVRNLLADCQDAAISLGNLIEESEGEGFITVKYLEDYCELLFHASEDEGDERLSAFDSLDSQLETIENSVRNDIQIKKEVVFLPYKAAMWDSLESVWKRMKDDPSVDTFVIPIPYYDKNPDGSLRTMHLEADCYPDYVEVTDFRKYDFAGRHPDEIYIHNPYDDCNYVTSVHPAFYSKELKKYTDKLVYIPYFVLDEIDPDNRCAVESMSHFVTVPGVVNADETIVQSGKMRQCYINALTKMAGEETRHIWEEKIKAGTSPKLERLLSTKEVELPEKWKKVVMKPDGQRKKIVLYNTSVSALLTHDEKMLEKIRSVFQVFRENADQVALLWRPHPLIAATMESMRPLLFEEYQKIVEDYKKEDFGIYDDSPDVDRALALADAYYGDPSSLVTMARAVKIPIMIQNPDII